MFGMISSCYDFCTISQSWPSYYCWVSNTSVPVGQGFLPDGDRLLLLEGAPDQEHGWQDVFAKELQPTCPTSSWRCRPALGRRRSMGCWSRWRRGCPRDLLPGCAPTSSNCGTCGGQSYIDQMSQKGTKILNWNRKRTSRHRSSASQRAVSHWSDPTLSPLVQYWWQYWLNTGEETPNVKRAQ